MERTTNRKGKGVEYAAIGIGTAAAIGLAGYGIYDLITSTTSCGPGTPCGTQMQTCDKELSTLTNQYIVLYNQFLAEDVKNNVPFSSAQQSLLNQNLAQQQAVMQNCVASVSKTYNLNFIESAASDIALAIAIGITLYFGAKAYAYIRGKYMKTPPKTPGTGGGIIQMGLIDYQKTTGKIPASWNSSGTGTATSIVGNVDAINQTYAAELVNLTIVNEATAAALIAAEAALIAEDEALLLIVLA